MTDQKDDYELAKEVEFKLNEPAKPIPGGSYRESRRASIEEYPDVERRLQLNRILLIHDPEVAAEALEQIGEEDSQLLQRMAQESVLSGSEPALRRNAIAVLGRFPTVDNLNFLSSLARYGEDPYVRGASLSALADAKIELTLPLLKDGLAARDPIEYHRAEEALLRLGREFGVASIEELLVRERRKTVRSRLTSVLEALREDPAKEVRRERQATVED